MAYYPYNYHIQDLQNMRDRIDRTIQQYQQSQVQQPMQPITQNFQITPTQSNNELESKYANSIEEVKNTFVIKTGVFLTKDYKTMWVKDVTGNIKTYNLEEVIELDAKDKKILEQNNTIASLQEQINELKGVIKNANEHDNADIDESVAEKKSARVSSSAKSSTK